MARAGSPTIGQAGPGTRWRIKDSGRAGPSRRISEANGAKDGTPAEEVVATLSSANDLQSKPSAHIRHRDWVSAGDNHPVWLQSDFARAAISLTFVNVRSNSDLRYCSCARSVGLTRNATLTKKRFNSEVIKRLSECFERSAVSWRRISTRSSVSWSGCSLK